MKNFTLALIAVVIGGIVFSPLSPAQEGDDIGKAVTQYFDDLFDKLKTVAEGDPDVNSFRRLMRPVVESVGGLYGATLIDPDFVIRQVYFHSHFLARGFDLKKVKELKDFYRMMKEDPAPQLSEPGHGNLFQPRLIAMRYPVIKDGKLKNIVSIMVRTASFLKATGLDKCKAFKIICLGKLAEKKGELSANYREVVLKLPSTEWVIQYDK